MLFCDGVIEIYFSDRDGEGKHIALTVMMRISELEMGVHQLVRRYVKDADLTRGSIATGGCSTTVWSASVFVKI